MTGAIARLVAIAAAVCVAGQLAAKWRAAIFDRAAARLAAVWSRRRDRRERDRLDFVSPAWLRELADRTVAPGATWPASNERTADLIRFPRAGVDQVAASSRRRPR